MEGNEKEKNKEREKENKESFIYSFFSEKQRPKGRAYRLDAFRQQQSRAEQRKRLQLGGGDCVAQTGIVHFCGQHGQP